MIVTSSDLGINLKCSYTMDNMTVSNEQKFVVDGGLENPLAQSQTVDAPNITLTITDR